MTGYFASRTPPVLTAIGILTVLFIGVIDSVTGAELSFSIFYLIPIAFVTWFAGKMPGLLIAVLSAVTWLAADLVSAPGYSHPAIPLWNGAARLGIFFVMAYLLSSMRCLTADLEQAVRKKTALLSAEIQARKELQKEVTELTTRQRQEIAYELHDSLCPLLGGIALKARVLEDSLTGQDSIHASSAGELVALLKSANKKTRLLARVLDPIAVELHGFPSALRKLAEDTEKLFQVSCIFATDLSTAPLNPLSALQLYRIAQEAIHNAVRHGEAKYIKIELLNGSADLRLKITDDGRGFFPDRVSTEGSGMRIMRFRAECIGGVLRVESSPSRGTCVACCLANVFPTGATKGENPH